MDHACHGTKIVAWALGRTASLEDLKLTYGNEIRLGIAPGARAIVVSAMTGALTQESGTIVQFKNALNWAVRNRRRQFPFDIICLAVELVGLSHTSKLVFGRILAQMEREQLVAIVAAGNNGPLSLPLGSCGTYIGALGRDGSKMSYTGSRVDLWAPGDDLFCAHPLTPQLNGALIGKYSGTSLATAIVAGAVAGVASKAKITANEALQALKVTADSENRINIDRAIWGL